MIQERYDNFYKHFYVNSQGDKRKHGIFAPGLDRFILIDDMDFWMTFETAEILSSKLPTVAYMLPPSAEHITSEKCIKYTIRDKRLQRVGPSPIVGGRQHPLLKFLYDKDEIIEAGIPEDYKSNITILTQLIEYANFVKQQVYVINITDAFYNFENTNRFAERYLDNSWTEQISSRVDRSQLKKGIFFELRKILYLSNSIEEAEEKIVEFWKNNYTDQVYLMEGYYKILNKPLPETLAPLTRINFTNISTMLF